MNVSFLTRATPESQRMYERAAALAATCPPELGREIAVLGSVARGLADAQSDLEIALWNVTLPPVTARAGWLADQGVTDLLVSESARSDGSFWIAGRLDGVPFEASWQTVAALEAALHRIAAIESFEREVLALAELIASAQPLRTVGWLARWQALLAVFPPALERAIIDDVAGRWARAERWAALARLARRGECLLLAERLVAELDALLRLLYAVNRRWEPSRKWTLTLAADLPRMPARWRDRIKAVLCASGLEAVELCRALLLDGLALVSPEIDTSVAQTALRSPL
ncbi:MAG: DUF4037 domain-containing protein [Aggregatilineales bacterium]